MAHTLQQKIAALDALQAGAATDDVAAQAGVSAATIRKWQRDRAAIRAEQRRIILERAHLYEMLTLEQIAQRALHLAQSLDDASIANAPLN